MMRRSAVTSRAAKAVLAMIGVLMLTSCSSIRGTGPQPPPSTATESPMARYLSALGYQAAWLGTGDPGQRIGEGVTKCADSERVDDLPAPVDTSRFVVTPNVIVGRSDPAWVELHGYGITESIRRQLEEGTAGAKDASASAVPDVTSADDSARCDDGVDAEVASERSLAPGDSELWLRIQKLYHDASLDRRIIDVDHAWADCYVGMTGDHGYTSPAAARLAFAREAAAMSPGRGRAGEWRTLIDREIAVARTDFICRGRVSWDTTRNAIIFAWEQEFIDRHQAELDAWIDAHPTGEDLGR